MQSADSPDRPVVIIAVNDAALRARLASELHAARWVVVAVGHRDDAKGLIERRRPQVLLLDPLLEPDDARSLLEWLLALVDAPPTLLVGEGVEAEQIASKHRLSLMAPSRIATSVVETVEGMRRRGTTKRG